MSIKRSWYQIHTSTFVVALVLLLSSCWLNVIGGPPTIHQTQNTIPTLKERRVKYGWPIAAFQSIRMFEDGVRVPRHLLAAAGYATWPNGDVCICNITATVTNVMLATILIVAAGITSEYWVRQRRGPFQFGIRSLFVLTTISCVILSLLRSDALNWSHLLLLPIRFGCASTVIVVALLFERSFSSSDTRLADARKRFTASKDGR